MAGSGHAGSGGSGVPGGNSSKFSFNSLRSSSHSQPDLSRRLFKLIKSENNVINAYTNAGRERQSIASQLSDWGQETNDDAVDDISDKLGVIMSEIGESEEQFAHELEDYRLILKHIRNTEKSVQPSRDHKQKLTDQIGQLKYKEPTSAKLASLEQELVRAEAESLVAEAQLTNVTRQKLKEAYDQHFMAHIARAEKQIILAKYGRKMLGLLDDTPVVPGDKRESFAQATEARDLLHDIERELSEFQLDLDPVETTKLEVNLMPSNAESEPMGNDVGDTNMTETTTEPSTMPTNSTSQPNAAGISTAGPLAS